MSNQILDAIMAKGKAMTWGAGKTWAYTSRRLKLFHEVPSQPALMQTSEDEAWTARTGQDPKRKIAVRWFIYHDVGADPNAEPDRETSDIVEALLGLFPADSAYSQNCTLGGLVHSVRIEGGIKKVSGDIDGQALIVVPITVILP